jgi:ATP-dependent Clp protease ATP-binding subunit ClpA
MQVIPFLPFEQEHIVEIIALKLKNLDRNYRGKYWHRLWVEVSSSSRCCIPN